LRIEQLREEKDRYYTERQILYDEARNMRIFLANKYISGQGIEIGATYLPLPVPHEAKVRYMDIVSEQELYKLYPDIRKHKLAHIDLIDDGEKLSTIQNSSQNFVIANHFLEHTTDPISTILTFYRVLKRAGIMYMCVPDKRYTFDFDREVTPLERLVDFREHPQHAEAARPDLFLEIAKKIEKWPTKKEQAARAKELMDQNFSIHYNVWTQHDLLELLHHIIKVHKLKLDIEAFTKNQHEIIMILRKQPAELKRNPNKGAGEIAHAKKKRDKKLKR
jgi:predicted SAM-dependent methyltransferase